MAARDHYSASSLGVSTDGASGFVTKTTLTFTPLANKAYAVMGRCALRTNPNDAIARMYPDDDTGVIGDAGGVSNVYVQKNTTDDWYSCSWLYVILPSASPIERTWTLDFAGWEPIFAAFDDCSIRQAVVTAWELSAQDQYTSAAGGGGYSNTFSDGVSKTWTPASVGDYLVIANMQVFDDGHNIGEFRIEHSSTGYRTAQMHLHAGDGRSYFSFQKLTALAASSQTVRLQGRSLSSSADIGLLNPTLLILRLDQFTEVNYAEVNDRTTGNQTSPSDRVSLEVDVAADDYLVLGGAITDEGSFGTTSKVVGRLWDDDDATSPDYNQTEIRCLAATGGDKQPLNATHIATYGTSGTRTFRVQWWRTAGTISAKGIQHAAIAVLRLETPPPELRSSGVVLLVGDARLSVWSKLIAAGVMIIKGAASLSVKTGTRIFGTRIFGGWLGGEPPEV